MIHGFFDESAEERVGHGYLAVAGYVFDDEGVRALDVRWQELLARYRLPYFHMAECNADDPRPPNVFAHLTKDERISAATEAINIARTYPLHGAAYVVRQEDYRQVLEDGGFACDAYSFLLWTALLQVAKWCSENRPGHPLALQFEAGYKSQSTASDRLRFVVDDEVVWRNKRPPPTIEYLFFDKESSCPGQAADLLAWHVRKGNASAHSGKALRKDTLALIEDRKVWTVHYPRERLISIRDAFVAKSGSLENAAKILFTSDDPFSGGPHIGPY